MSTLLTEKLSTEQQRAILASSTVAGFADHHPEGAQSDTARIRSRQMDILQINVGKLCNQACSHCHVDAGPDKITENMSWETFSACIEVARQARPRTVDLTGGAPELNPRFRDAVIAFRAAGVEEIIDRCNLTVLLMASQKGLVEFLAEQRVHIVASLPAVNEQQTDAQRGDGVFTKSIKALQLLNAHGYGIAGTGLELTLMSNPSGAFLPPAQSSAEERFRRLLKQRYDISFTRLIELTNMPVSRYLEYLLASGNYERYMQKLSAAYNPAAINGLMCRNTLSVSWDGGLYDCDFNQMLEMPVATPTANSIFTYNRELLHGREIVVGKHCLGCTAGQGSSCGGALE